jgi:hypothetical protein
MIVRAKFRRVRVFPAGKIPEWAKGIAKFLTELTKVVRVKGRSTVFGKGEVFGSVSKGEEHFVLMEFSFMVTPQSPRA